MLLIKEVGPLTKNNWQDILHCGDECSMLTFMWSISSVLSIWTVPSLERGGFAHFFDFHVVHKLARQNILSLSNHTFCLKNLTPPHQLPSSIIPPLLLCLSVLKLKHPGSIIGSDFDSLKSLWTELRLQKREKSLWWEASGEHGRCVFY